MSACGRCDGCGRVGSDDEHAPWTFWESLPPGSDLAVRMGLVVPLPCLDCGGTGEAILADPRLGGAHE